MKPALSSCRPRSGLPLNIDLITEFCRADGLPLPQREYQFAPNRRYRADWCWPESMVILEQNGGIWTKGGHNTGRGLLRDYEKANLAQLLGYVYLQVTPDQIRSGAVLALLKEALR